MMSVVANDDDDSPAAVIERARLAIDPVRAMNAFRTIEAFRRWSDAKPGRVMQALTLKVATTDLVGMVEVKLFDGRAVVAETLSHDYFDALANALAIAAAS